MEGIMQLRGVPDLKGLDYQPQNFRDLFETELGQEIWGFMKRPENVVRMETATFLERAAVEPLAPGLLTEFGPDVGEDRIKQMIGHMARQVMEAIGYEIERPGLRITRESLFSSAARYRKPGDDRDRSMKITREQRDAWKEKTASSPFNRWLDRKVKRPDGSLDLDQLYAVAQQYGIEKQYHHLNPGQQRMSIGIMLRKAVPETEYADA
jgi:hypothetical protein